MSHEYAFETAASAIRFGPGATREVGAVMSADQTRVRALPVNGEAFEPFEKLLVEQRSVGQ